MKALSKPLSNRDVRVHDALDLDALDLRSHPVLGSIGSIGSIGSTRSFQPLWMNDEKDIYTSLFD